VANFHARFVFGLDDEKLSVALVGPPAAMTLGGPARIGGVVDGPLPAAARPLLERHERVLSRP
jgi:hypothetical protein